MERWTRASGSSISLRSPRSPASPKPEQSLMRKVVRSPDFVLRGDGPTGYEGAVARRSAGVASSPATVVSASLGFER